MDHARDGAGGTATAVFGFLSSDLPLPYSQFGNTHRTPHATPRSAGPPSSRRAGAGRTCGRAPRTGADPTRDGDRGPTALRVPDRNRIWDYPGGPRSRQCRATRMNLSSPRFCFRAGARGADLPVARPLVARSRGSRPSRIGGRLLSAHFGSVARWSLRRTKTSFFAQLGGVRTNRQRGCDETQCSRRGIVVSEPHASLP